MAAINGSNPANITKSLSEKLLDTPSKKIAVALIAFGAIAVTFSTIVLSSASFMAAIGTNATISVLMSGYASVAFGSFMFGEIFKKKDESINEDHKIEASAVAALPQPPVERRRHPDKAPAERLAAAAEASAVIQDIPDIVSPIDADRESIQTLIEIYNRENPGTGDHKRLRKFSIEFVFKYIYNRKESESMIQRAKRVKDIYNMLLDVDDNVEALTRNLNEFINHAGSDLTNGVWVYDVNGKVKVKKEGHSYGPQELEIEVRQNIDGKLFELHSTYCVSERFEPIYIRYEERNGKIVFNIRLNSQMSSSITCTHVERHKTYYKFVEKMIEGIFGLALLEGASEINIEFTNEDSYIKGHISPSKCNGEDLAMVFYDFGFKALDEIKGAALKEKIERYRAPDKRGRRKDGYPNHIDNVLFNIKLSLKIEYDEDGKPDFKKGDRIKLIGKEFLIPRFAEQPRIFTPYN